MQSPRRLSKQSMQYVKHGLGLTLVGSFLWMIVVGTGPDIDLNFIREMNSELTPARVDAMISSTTRWPQWFYSLSTAHLLDAPDSPHALVAGKHLLLNMDPGKGEYKKFELEFLIESYVPNQSLDLKLVRDSSGRLTRVFDRLDWRIEIEPRAGGSLIRGRATAHTHHWRARILGKIAERIVMNQSFYPNLIQLADLKQPFSLDPQDAPASARRGRDRTSLW